MVYIPQCASHENRAELLRAEQSNLAMKEELLKKAEVQLKEWEKRLNEKEALLEVREKTLLSQNDDEMEGEVKGEREDVPTPLAPPTIIKDPIGFNVGKMLEAIVGQRRPQFGRKTLAKPPLRKLEEEKLARDRRFKTEDASNPQEKTADKKKEKQLHSKNSWQFWMEENRERLMQKACELDVQRSSLGSVALQLGAQEWRQLADKSHWKEMAKKDAERVRDLKLADGVKPIRGCHRVHK